MLLKERKYYFAYFTTYVLCAHPLAYFYILYLGTFSNINACFYSLFEWCTVHTGGGRLIVFAASLIALDSSLVSKKKTMKIVVAR
jgi:hypothetical protein